MIEVIFTTLVAALIDDTQIQQQGLMHSKSAERYDINITKSQEDESILKSFAKLRTAFIYRDDHSISHDTNYSTAVGGYVGVDTSSYKGFNLHLAGYISAELEGLSGDESHQNQEFLDAEGHSYIYLGEASLVYKTEGLEAMVGRIKIDTPYADSDDSRMSPNTFEGAWAYAEISENLSSQVYYLRRMAGSGSSGSQNEFDPLYDADAFGLAGVGLDYHVENNEASLWYYYVDKMSHILYAEAHFGIDFSENLNLDTALQASSIIEMQSSGIEGDVIGASAVLHFKKLFFGGAYNYGFVSNDKQITDGFGGGPYYTSLDEATISAVSSVAIGENVQAHRVGIGYEAVFFDNLVLEFIQGHLKSEHKTVDVKENDIILAYQFNEALYFELIGAKYKARQNNNKFERLVIRLDYSF